MLAGPGDQGIRISFSLKPVFAANCLSRCLPELGELRMLFAGKRQDAVVVRDVVFVGDEREGDRRIVLVGHVRVAVDVVEIFFLELDHQLLDDGVVLAKAL